MKITFLLLLLISVFNKTNAQQLELMGASGTYTVTTGLGLSWSLGEVVIPTSISPTHALTQGFQQADLYAVDINEYAANIKINLYPNPAVNFVQVDASENVYLTILSTDGKLIETIQINSNQSIDISPYPRGNYFFHFRDKNGIQFKAIRVIKN